MKTQLHDGFTVPLAREHNSDFCYCVLRAISGQDGPVCYCVVGGCR